MAFPCWLFLFVDLHALNSFWKFEFIAFWILPSPRGQWFRFVSRWFRQRTNHVYPHPELTNSTSNYRYKFSIVGIAGLMLKRGRKTTFWCCQLFHVYLNSLYSFFSSWPHCHRNYNFRINVHCWEINLGHLGSGTHILYYALYCLLTWELLSFGRLQKLPSQLLC